MRLATAPTLSSFSPGCSSRRQRAFCTWCVVNARTQAHCGLVLLTPPATLRVACPFTMCCAYRVYFCVEHRDLKRTSLNAHSDSARVCMHACLLGCVRRASRRQRFLRGTRRRASRQSRSCLSSCATRSRTSDHFQTPLPHSRHACSPSSELCLHPSPRSLAAVGHQREESEPSFFLPRRQSLYSPPSFSLPHDLLLPHHHPRAQMTDNLPYVAQPPSSHPRAPCFKIRVRRVPCRPGC